VYCGTSKLVFSTALSFFPFFLSSLYYIITWGFFFLVMQSGPLCFSKIHSRCIFWSFGGFTGILSKGIKRVGDGREKEDDLFSFLLDVSPRATLVRGTLFFSFYVFMALA
jgi:hypothetical protein